MNEALKVSVCTLLLASFCVGQLICKPGHSCVMVGQSPGLYVGECRSAARIFNRPTFFKLWKKSDGYAQDFGACAPFFQAPVLVIEGPNRIEPTRLSVSVAPVPAPKELR
jgi:hypothetical protein